MNKILVAYDGGDPGRRALDLAGKLARAFGARVDVVSVIPESFGRVEGSIEEPAIVHAKELVEARDRLRAQGIDVGLIEPAGEPAETIERVASEGGYDTVIMGASRSGNGVPIVGHTVTARVAANAEANIIVTR